MGSEASCQCIVGFEKNNDDDCVAGKCVTTLRFMNGESGDAVCGWTAKHRVILCGPGVNQ